MALTRHYYTKFEPGCFYHVYNRSVDRKPMFKSDANYEFFLHRYDYYISDYAETYAYCLMNNHFHLLIRVRDLTTFQKLSNLPTHDAGNFEKLSNLPTLPAHDALSRQFRKLFQSYAMAFNKQQDRIGTLFQTPFKRALVDNEAYFTKLVYYIHANPQMHGFIDDFREYPWSSYGRILIPYSTKLRKQEVLQWFGGREEFAKRHAGYKVEADDALFIED